MRQIEIVPGRSKEFTERFKLEVPGLLASEEFRRLAEDERNIPGLVFSVAAALAEKDSEAAAAVARIVEDGAAAEDAELHNYLITEIFEHWEYCAPEVRRKLLGLLGPASSELFGTWSNVWRRAESKIGRS